MSAETTPRTLLVALGLSLLASCAGAGREAATPADPSEFVHRVYFHGVPYEEARRLGQDAVPVLLAMLDDPAEARWWPNVVVTLCILADPRCVDPVVRFVTDSGRSAALPAYETARRSGIMALGYVVNARRDADALAFLERACHPDWWTGLGAEAPNELGTMAVLGLALAGTPEARQALLALGGTRAANAIAADSPGLLEEALRTNEEIADLGLAEYYRRGDAGGH